MRGPWNATGVALSFALTLTSACARVQPRPLGLPPPGASLERRIVAYRQRAAMPHMGMNGWDLRVGQGVVGDLSADRPYLANSAEAEDILHERDSQLALGWTILGVSLATVLGSLAFMLASLGSSDPDRFSVTPAYVALGGSVLMLPGTLIMANAQRRVPPAVEAYNRWLWRALELPTDAPPDAVPAAASWPAATPPAPP